MSDFIIYDEHRQPRKLGDKVGGGGQGNIYALAENPNIVVKIFNQEKLKERGHELREKVFVQIRVLEDLIRSPYVTWPQIEIFDRNDQWMGYAMKRAKGIPLSNLAHPMLYLKYFPNIDRKGIVQILLHLLDTIDILHKKEIYLGDINLSNFLADPSTFKVYLIDTDSYQVKNARTSQIYPCPVGRPEMTPVEHHGQDFGQVVRTLESDLFSLAILMFQCLMLGQHPYSQVGGGNPVENLRKGNFPYGKGNARPGEMGSLPPGPWYIIWSHLTFNVKSLFIRTLKDGVGDPLSRASLAEWRDALQKYYFAMHRDWNTSEIRPAEPKISRDNEERTI
ncbi:MAG: hypothetical protein V7K68_10250 [Nostoc sp.]|uniref:hypothetical protein n=1 Tax=Nostoc sp. TaxID=1180 RepID=UPI002FFB6F6B